MHDPFPDFSHPAHAIRWSHTGTVGNIAASTPYIDCPFPPGQDHALFPCEFVEAGKFRNGAPRWWCRTHFEYWGRKAELVGMLEHGVKRCSAHDTPQEFLLDPLQLRTDHEPELAIWYRAEPALTSVRGYTVREKILLGIKRPHDDFSHENLSAHRALSMIIPAGAGLFANPAITHIQITPQAAKEFSDALTNRWPVASIDCRRCKFPHLDLGTFAQVEHGRHYCGNCGCDSTQGKPVVSNPLQVLHERLSVNPNSEVATGTLDLAHYAGCQFALWPSTQAIIWKVASVQKHGIHTRIWRDGQVVLDRIVATVKLNGRWLDRETLLAMSLQP